ncbi:MAG: hypothetical protein R3324_20165 [Halobacteriales archaeon]|nr:hypothetical protein [Halobacteriales archaeon]
MTDGNGSRPGDGAEPYTPVEVAFARDGTPVFGFETEVARVGDPLEFDFVLLHGDGTVRFGVHAGERLTVVARAGSARRLAERLVEYGSYDVAVSYGDRTRNPGTDDQYDEVTRYRLDGSAYDRLYEAYLGLGADE